MAIKQIRTIQDVEYALIDVDNTLRKLMVQIGELDKRIKKLEDANSTNSKR
jgi:hypothetical protein